eukprot:SAG31_NODE_791_length_12069_cov_22.664411_3_plen_71_part_00
METFCFGCAGTTLFSCRTVTWSSAAMVVVVAGDRAHRARHRSFRISPALLLVPSAIGSESKPLEDEVDVT